mgnify:CR=1 FL=1
MHRHTVFLFLLFDEWDCIFRVKGEDTEAQKIVSEFPERFVKEPALLHFGLYDRNPSD